MLDLSRRRSSRSRRRCPSSSAAAQTRKEDGGGEKQAPKQQHGGPTHGFTSSETLPDPTRTPWRADLDLSRKSRPCLLGPGVSALDGSASHALRYMARRFAVLWETRFTKRSCCAVRDRDFAAVKN